MSNGLDPLPASRLDRQSLIEAIEQSDDQTDFTVFARDSGLKEDNGPHKARKLYDFVASIGRAMSDEAENRKPFLYALLGNPPDFSLLLPGDIPEYLDYAEKITRLHVDFGGIDFQAPINKMYQSGMMRVPLLSYFKYEAILPDNLPGLISDDFDISVFLQFVSNTSLTPTPARKRKLIFYYSADLIETFSTNAYAFDSHSAIKSLLFEVLNLENILQNKMETLINNNDRWDQLLNVHEPVNQEIMTNLKKHLPDMLKNIGARNQISLLAKYYPDEIESIYAAFKKDIIKLIEHANAFTWMKNVFPDKDIENDLILAYELQNIKIPEKILVAMIENRSPAQNDYSRLVKIYGLNEDNNQYNQHKARRLHDFLMSIGLQNLADDRVNRKTFTLALLGNPPDFGLLLPGDIDEYLYYSKFIKFLDPDFADIDVQKPLNEMHRSGRMRALVKNYFEYEELLPDNIPAVASYTFLIADFFNLAEKYSNSVDKLKKLILYYASDLKVAFEQSPERFTFESKLSLYFELLDFQSILQIVMEERIKVNGTWESLLGIYEPANLEIMSNMRKYLPDVLSKSPERLQIYQLIKYYPDDMVTIYLEFKKNIVNFVTDENSLNKAKQAFPSQDIETDLILAYRLQNKIIMPSLLIMLTKNKSQDQKVKLFELLTPPTTSGARIYSSVKDFFDLLISSLQKENNNQLAFTSIIDYYKKTIKINFSREDQSYDHEKRNAGNNLDSIPENLRKVFFDAFKDQISSQIKMTFKDFIWLSSIFSEQREDLYQSLKAKLPTILEDSSLLDISMLCDLDFPEYSEEIHQVFLSQIQSGYALKFAIGKTKSYDKLAVLSHKFYLLNDTELMSQFYSNMPREQQPSYFNLLNPMGLIPRYDSLLKSMSIHAYHNTNEGQVRNFAKTFIADLHIKRDLAISIFQLLLEKTGLPHDVLDIKKIREIQFDKAITINIDKFRDITNSNLNKLEKAMNNNLFATAWALAHEPDENLRIQKVFAEYQGTSRTFLPTQSAAASPATVSLADIPENVKRAAIRPGASGGMDASGGTGAS